MNALRKSLDDLKFTIPRPILETVFVKRHSNYRIAAPSLDEQILNSVVRPRVYIDTNLVGGAEIPLGLSQIQLAVFKRPPRELARIGQAKSER